MQKLNILDAIMSHKQTKFNTNNQALRKCLFLRDIHWILRSNASLWI